MARFSPNTQDPQGVLDQLAQAHGYPNMDAAVADRGETALQLANRWGVSSDLLDPQGTHQAADSDYTVPLWQDFAALAAAGAGGGLLGSALSGGLGGAAAGGTGAAAPAALTTSATPLSSVLAGLPTSTTLGAVPAVAGAAGAAALPAAASTTAGASPFAATGPAAMHTTAAGDIGSTLGAGGAGSSFLQQLSRYIGPGVALAQTLVGRNATNTARDQLVAANTKAATDLHSLYGNTANTLGGIAQRQQQNLAPYTALGGAASLLGQGLGLPAGSIPQPNAAIYQPQNPFTSPPPSNSLPMGGGFLPPGTTLGPTGPMPPGGGQRPVPPDAGMGGGAIPRSSAQTGGVRMIAPTGEVGMVPPEKVAAAQAAGARLVS